jgi:peptidyl-prolyl cis-trans isomerase C
MSTANQTSSCTVKPPVSVRPKAVSVNGIQIARDAIARETQNHPASKPIEAWQAAARALVVRELLLQEAERLDLSALPSSDESGRRETDDEARMRALIEQEVVTSDPDEPTCRRFYLQNQHRFRSQDMYEVSHILVPSGHGDMDRERANELAGALLGVLRDDPSSFETLARRHSACPSAQVGGSLGQIGPGQTVPEFDSALTRMKADSIHPEPIESRYGLHIVRLHHKIEGRQLAFEIARPLIETDRKERLQRTAQRRFICLLAGRAVIEGIILDASDSPLMN